MLRIIGKTSGDYFNFTCADCGGTVQADDLGLDGAIPKFTATCVDCKKTGTYKLGGWNTVFGHIKKG